MKNHQTIVVTTEQMQNIENAMFARGMPIASLMEKASLLSSGKIADEYPLSKYPLIGFIIGCGHNGGDGLVIARELFLRGYRVRLYTPLADKCKDLTAQHLQYAQSLPLEFVESIEALQDCNLIIDCLFGFGLNRPIDGFLKDDLILLNQWQKSIVSIDVPSGIHTDTGKVLGVAVKAEMTLCLGLWKLGLFQSPAWEYTGKLIRIDLGIPPDIYLSHHPLDVNIITSEKVRQTLPLPRAVNTHKYRQGNLLLICGSRQYAGAGLLSAYGANASGVGMLTMLVPASLQPLINQHIPSALVIACEETPTGVINSIPNLDLSKYKTIGFGMGITKEITPSLKTILTNILHSQASLLIDADGFFHLLNLDFPRILSQRQGETILTPHEGEFKRLFPHLSLEDNRLEALKQASAETNSTILLKGAKTMISDKGKENWIIKEGTPALARGGSGDVLSGFIAGLVAQTSHSMGEIVAVGGCLHQQAGILASEDLTELGVDGVTLSRYLVQSIKKSL